MSCQHCKYNNKPSCDPEVNDFGGCANFRANWEPDEPEEPETDIFESMKVFKPEVSE